MTVTEFESYLQKGLGRAILLLREEPDKTPFWEPLSRHILSFNETANARCYHHALGIYEVELIRCFDDSGNGQRRWQTRYLAVPRAA